MTPRLADVLLAELRADPNAAADIASVLAPMLAASVPMTIPISPHLVLRFQHQHPTQPPGSYGPIAGRQRQKQEQVG
jgi:hypothetical protein